MELSVEADNTTILNLVVVFCILAALTCGTDLEQLKNRIKKPKGVSIGLLCQFGILPATAFVIAYILEELFEDFSQPQGVALIILGSCPGGNVSNIFCFLWNADLSLSIAMTTASSLCSFAFLTVNCAIYIPMYSKGDTVKMDYELLAFSVGMVIFGICVGFIVAYYDNKTMKKILGVGGVFATCYMIWRALFDNATGTAPIWTLSWQIWVAPISLCSVAWIFSLIIAIMFKLPNKSVLSVCFESGNQNSVLAIAIIYLTLDKYDDTDIHLAIGIPILSTIIAILFSAIGGLIASQLKWVHCKYEEDIRDGDNTLTLSVLIYRYKQWRESKKNMQLLSKYDADYGGTKLNVVGHDNEILIETIANSDEQQTHNL